MALEQTLDVRSNAELFHRGIKQRYYPTLGFGAFESAKCFCQAFDEVRNFFRPPKRMAEFVLLSFAAAQAHP